MNRNDTHHPVCTMCANAQTLRDQAKTTHSQAAHGAQQARKASEALAALDIDHAFRQLRQMVALLNDRPGQGRRAANVVEFPTHRQAVFAQAAE